MINKFSLLFICIFIIVVSRILKLVILSFGIVLSFRGFFMRIAVHSPWVAFDLSCLIME